MPSSTRIQLENWLKTIDVKGVRVLDIGGSQKPIHGRIKSFDPAEYKILDLPEPHEQKIPPDIAIDIERPIDSQKLVDLGQFDMIFCLELMEYVLDPRQVMRNIAALTKEGGKLYISFVLLYPIHKPEGADMLRYTENAVRRLLMEAGFRITHTVYRMPRNPKLFLEVWKAESMKKLDEDSSLHTGYLITAIKEAPTAAEAGIRGEIHS